MHRAVHFLTRKEILLIIASVLVGGASVWVSFSYAATASNLFLNADGHYGQWTASDAAASTHFTMVDDTKCNGQQDFVYTTSIGNRDSYNVNLNAVPDGYKITAIEIMPCASLHTSGYGSPKLSLFYRFNGVDSSDKGSYALSGTTPRSLSSTKFSGLSLVKNSESKLEIGAVLTGFGTTGARLSRLATRLTITPPPPPTLGVKIDTNYPRLLNDRYILAGTERALAGRIELKATGGDVKLKNLVVNVSSRNTRPDIENTFATISIYEDPAMTKLLASKQVTVGAVALQNINYVIPKDTTQYLYLGLTVNGIGTGENSTAISNVTVTLGLKDNLTTAVSVLSNKELPKRDVVVLEKVYTKAMTTLAAQVVDVSSRFTGGTISVGEQTFFTFGVTAHAGTNTDQTGDSLSVFLTRLKLQLASDVANVTNIKLCRVNNAMDDQGCIDLQQVTPISGNNDITMLQTATDGFVDMTDFAITDNRRISNGETAYFELRGTFSNVADKYAQGSVQDVHSSGIVWGYDLDSNGSLDFTFTDLKKTDPRPSGYPDIFGGVLH